MHGALLVDKPSGPTSHDVVAFARRALETRAIGHTGTLDPLATGLLVLLIGHATRLSQFLVTEEKEYIAGIRLGRSTPTYDAQGLEAADAKRDVRGAMRVDNEVGDSGREVRVTPEQIRQVLATFVGTFPQLPPPFSAKKVGGIRAYQKARRNEPVDLTPVNVTVRELELLPVPPASRLASPSSSSAPRDSDATLLRLRVACSSGFYVRSLAHDIGRSLGCGAHLEALRRTRAGQFDVRDALSLEALEQADAIASRLIEPKALLAGMAEVSVTEEGQRRAWNGNALAPIHVLGPLPELPADGRKVRILTPSGGLLAVAERRADGLLHPLVVLR
jgi:tRNA pseudouridine55 synthase